MSDTLLDELRALRGNVTPGPWEQTEDPFDGHDHKTLIELPTRSGLPGTRVARTEQNWTEAAAGERRISWKEATANARLIALCGSHLDTIIAALEAKENNDG